MARPGLELTIVHFYPRLMNIYGDRGNVVALTQRCLKRGIKVKVTSITIGDRLDPKAIDIFFGGGGQDKQQAVVSKDLLKQASAVEEIVANKIPGLIICGTYQLFGRYFKTTTGQVIPGLGLLDLYTQASPQRKIGNVVVKLSQDLINLELIASFSPYLVGFENHSGETFIGSTVQPLGEVVLGTGNNSLDKTEGIVYHHVVGTYLHGPILPKNPHLADYLILAALMKKYGITRLDPLDDTEEKQAHQAAIKRAKQLQRRFPFLGL